MLRWGLEWNALDSYFQMVEITEPITPEANNLRLYAKDKAGVSALYYKNDAGTEFDLSIVGSALTTSNATWIDLTDGGNTTLHTHSIYVPFSHASWIDLTDGGATTLHTHAAGAGMAIGGSITSATAGSVLFAGVAGVLAQDNANFFWDDTNNDLFIGAVANPWSALAGGGFAIVKDSFSDLGSNAYAAGGGCHCCYTSWGVWRFKGQPFWFTHRAWWFIWPDAT